ISRLFLVKSNKNACELVGKQISTPILIHFIDVGGTRFPLFLFDPEPDLFGSDIIKEDQKLFTSIWLDQTIKLFERLLVRYGFTCACIDFEASLFCQRFKGIALSFVWKSYGGFSQSVPTKLFIKETFQV